MAHHYVNYSKYILSYFYSNSTKHCSFLSWFSRNITNPVLQALDKVNVSCAINVPVAKVLAEVYASSCRGDAKKTRKFKNLFESIAFG